MRLIKKANDQSNYEGLPEPVVALVSKEESIDNYYTHGAYKDLTEEEISKFNTTFPDMPISIMMITHDGEIFYGAFSQIVFHTSDKNYQIVADNGDRGFESQVITTDVQLLNQFMPYVKSFMKKEDFPIYLSGGSDIQFGVVMLDPTAAQIAGSQKEFNEYLFSIYLRNNQNSENTAKNKIKRLMKKGENMIPPVYPGQKPIMDLRKQRQNQNQNQNQQQNQQQGNQSFQQILEQEMNKNK